MPPTSGSSTSSPRSIGFALGSHAAGTRAHESDARQTAGSPGGDNHSGRSAGAAQAAADARGAGKRPGPELGPDGGQQVAAAPRVGPGGAGRFFLGAGDDRDGAQRVRQQ